MTTHVAVFGAGGRPMYEFVVAQGQTARFDLTEACYSIMVNDGSAPQSDLAPALAEANEKLERIREAGGWSEETWDE